MQSSTLRGDGRHYRSRVKAALPRTSGPGFLGIRVSFAAGAHSRAQSARNSGQLRSTETAWECGNRPQHTPYTLIAHSAGGERSLVQIQSPRLHGRRVPRVPGVPRPGTPVLLCMERSGFHSGIVVNFLWHLYRTSVITRPWRRGKRSTAGDSSNWLPLRALLLCCRRCLQGLSAPAGQAAPRSLCRRRAVRTTTGPTPPRSESRISPSASSSSALGSQAWQLPTPCGAMGLSASFSKREIGSEAALTLPI